MSMTRRWKLLITIVAFFLLAPIAWAAQQGGGSGQQSGGGGSGTGQDPNWTPYGQVLRGSTYYAADSTKNMPKSFLGLAAKGNIVIGDYTSSSFQTNVVPMIDRDAVRGVTSAYVLPDTTGTDAAYNNDPSGTSCGGKTPCFNGNYALTETIGATAQKRCNGASLTQCDATNQADRKFYESTISPTVFHNFVPSGLQDPQPCFGGDSGPYDAPCKRNGATIWIQAALYTNHAIIGDVSRSSWFGAWAGRDDALRFQGRFDMSYDWRLQDQIIAQQLALPMTLDPSSVVEWKEIPAP